MIPERFIYPSPGFSHYWQYGRGNKLIKKLSKIPDLESIKTDIPKLFQVDEIADRVIEELYLPLGFKQANALLDVVLTNGISGETPGSLRELFKAMELKPEWLNTDLIREGALFCNRTGIPGLIVLRDYCLMGGYESSAVNKPLIATGALKKGASKRMAETTDFWVNICKPDALERNGVGFKSLATVRLLHAYSRVMILKQGEWDTKRWGLPINRWDMLATNLGFSIVFLNGLKAFGFRITEQESRAVLHFWKYIGFMLGIPAHDLPDTEEEAIEKLYRWTITQAPADEDTLTLAASLSAEPMYAYYLKWKWQRKFLREAHRACNYFFLGESTCTTMQIPRSKFSLYPYLVKITITTQEFLARRFSTYRKKLVVRNRKRQEYIRRLLMNTHAK